MIKQSDLVNRMNIDGVCVDFDYIINIEDLRIRCRFSRNNNADYELPTWLLIVLLKRDGVKDSEVYNFSYQVPKANMDLTMVAAIGIKYFQMYIKKEIESKTGLDFVLGDITNGMVG